MNSDDFFQEHIEGYIKFQEYDFFNSPVCSFDWREYS